jgi:hypothetical protein
VFTTERPDLIDEIAANHQNFRRMPMAFGPASGPRNMPKDKAHLRGVGFRTEIAVSVLTDAKRLQRLLPPGTELRGEPVLTVSMTMLTELAWLAGRGYNILSLSVPVTYQGKEERIEGFFVPVLWESMADPVLTGREELGMPKLPANIATPRYYQGTYTGEALWDGFKFFEMEVSDLVPTDSEEVGGGLYRGGSSVNLTYRYMPMIGNLEEADASYMVRTTAATTPPTVTVDKRVGQGKFAFYEPRWEDMPTQYSYVAPLAQLPLLEFRNARYVRNDGIGDLAAYRKVR